MMDETPEQSLKWAIKHVKFDLEESLISRRVLKGLMKKGGNYENQIKMYETSARKYIQRIKNFKKLLKDVR